MEGPWHVPDPTNEGDFEKPRNGALLKEFQQILRHKGQVEVNPHRSVAGRVQGGWQKNDYETIIQIAKRVPEAVIQEDPALLMYYDNALMRKGE